MYVYEDGVVKRYVRKSSYNTSTGKKTRTTESVNIGLSKDCEFKHEDEVVVIRKEEFKKHMTEFENIKKELEKPTVISGEDGNFKNQYDVEELREIINKHNEYLFSKQSNIDNAVDDSIKLTKAKAKEIVDESNKKNREKIVNSLISVNRKSNENAVDNIIKEIVKQQSDFNREVNKIGLMDRLFRWKKPKFDVDVNQLKKVAKNHYNDAVSDVKIESLIQNDVSKIDGLDVKDEIKKKYDLQIKMIDVVSDVESEIVDVGNWKI